MAETEKTVAVIVPLLPGGAEVVYAIKLICEIPTSEKGGAVKIMAALAEPEVPKEGSVACSKAARWKPWPDVSSKIVAVVLAGRKATTAMKKRDAAAAAAVAVAREGVEGEELARRREGVVALMVSQPEARASVVAGAMDDTILVILQ